MYTSYIYVYIDIYFKSVKNRNSKDVHLVCVSHQHCLSNEWMYRYLYMRISTYINVCVCVCIRTSHLVRKNTDNFDPVSSPPPPGEVLRSPWRAIVLVIANVRHLGSSQVGWKKHAQKQIQQVQSNHQPHHCLTYIDIYPNINRMMVKLPLQSTIKNNSLLGWLFLLPRATYSRLT